MLPHLLVPLSQHERSPGQKVLAPDWRGLFGWKTRLGLPLLTRSDKGWTCLQMVLSLWLCSEPLSSKELPSPVIPQNVLNKRKSQSETYSELVWVNPGRTADRAHRRESGLVFILHSPCCSGIWERRDVMYSWDSLPALDKREKPDCSCSYSLVKQ